MIDLKRYWPLVVAGTWLATGLLVFEVTCCVALGWSPKVFWTGKVPNEWYDWVNNGRLVAGAQQARKRDAGRGLGLMVGASTTHYSLTSSSLDQCDGLNLDWLVITSTRMSFTVMEENVFEPLAMSPELASPELLTIGIHPEMLIGATELTPTFSAAWGSVTDAVRRGRWRAAAGALARASFIIHVRGRIANTLETRVSRARLAMLRAFGQGLPAIFYPPLPPYESRIPKAGNTTSYFSDDVIDHYLAAWNAAGFADVTKYSSRGPQADALRRIVTRYPGVPVLFVVMPVRSEFRSKETLASIGRVWNEIFLEFARTRPVSVVDLSAQVNNDGFKDIGHANVKGRAVIQKLVPRAIALATRTPAMLPNECSPGGRASVAVEQLAGR